MKKIIKLTESDLTRIVKRVINESSPKQPILVDNPKDPRLLKYKKQYGIWKKESDNSLSTEDYWVGKGYIKTSDMISSLKQRLKGFGLKEGTKCFNSAYNFFNKKIYKEVSELKSPNNFWKNTMMSTEYNKYVDYKPRNIFFYWELQTSTKESKQRDPDGVWIPPAGCFVGNLNYAVEINYEPNIYWEKPQEVRLVKKPTQSVTTQYPTPVVEPKPSVTTQYPTPVVEPKPSVTSQVQPTSQEKYEYAYRRQTIIKQDGTYELKNVPYSKKVNNKWVDVDAPRVIDYRIGVKKYDGGKTEKI